MNQKEFFGRHGDEYITFGIYDVTSSIRIEDLYHFFKARMMAELVVSAPDLRTLGVLVEKPEEA
jgi:hypothetical protein